MVVHAKKHKKSAFSLPEVLIVLGIVGFISMLMITMTKPNEHIIGMQYRKALRSLEVAAFNAHEDCIATNGCSFLSSVSVACTQLGEYFNTVSQDCANGKFKSSNGVEYEVMGNVNFDEVQYTIVYADINSDQDNGGRGPDSAVWSRSTPPDLVAFVINGYGEVAPVGSPMYDARYILAKVIYPDEDDNDTSVAMPYADAQMVAFGGTQYSYDAYSITNINAATATLYNRLTPTAGLAASRGLDPKCENDESARFPKCTLELVY